MSNPPSAPAGTTDAIVIDIRADLLPHGNGSGFVRLVMRLDDAQNLREALNINGQLADRTLQRRFDSYKEQGVRGINLP